MSKAAAVAVLIFVSFCSVSLAQDSKPPLDIAIYPGAETAMELNLTSEDILPMLQAMLPMMGAKLGPLAEKVQPDDIAALLKDLKRVEFVQLNIPRASVSEQEVVHYYAKNLPAGKWSRVFYRSQPAGSTAALYARNGMQAVYGFRVSIVNLDGKPAKRVEVLKTEGSIDLVKILTFAAKLAGSASAQENAPTQ